MTCVAPPRDRRLEVALQVADQRNQFGGKLHAERDGVAEHQASNGLIQRMRQSPSGAASQLQPSIGKGLLQFRTRDNDHPIYTKSL